MAKVEYIKCDICGRKIDNHFNITQVCNEYGIEGLRFYFGKLFKRESLDICSSCLNKIHKVSEDIKTEKELYEFALNSENAKYFKDNPDLYSAYLNGVEDAAKYLSHHQLTKVRWK